MIDKPEPRGFPPPWTVEETDACFIVRDGNGQVGPTSISRRSRTRWWRAAGRRV